MRLAGYQPQYFPRLHYFARMLDADVFEISDYVQFVKKHAYVDEHGERSRGKSFQADTPIKLASGEHFLTVPVRHGGLTPINKTEVVEPEMWAGKHLRSVQAGYRQALHGGMIVKHLTSLLGQPYPHLAALDTATILWALTWILQGPYFDPVKVSLDSVNKLLAGDHPFRLRRIELISKTDVQPAGSARDATDWIIDMCHHFGASDYYFGGTSGAGYMDFGRFEAAGITTSQQDWHCQPYTQQFRTRGFLSNLSIIDLLANEDRERVVEVLGGKKLRSPGGTLPGAVYSLREKSLG